MYQHKIYLYVFALILAISIAFTVYLYMQIQGLSAEYQVHPTYVNLSGWCGSNQSTEIVYYGNNCPACASVYNAFINTTSLFGLWQGDRFYSGYFCAYAVNLSAYNENKSIFAPPGAINLFEQLSNNKIPLLVFNGEFYKIGGYTNNQTADANILKYICMTINSSAPPCQ